MAGNIVAILRNDVLIFRIVNGAFNIYYTMGEISKMEHIFFLKYFGA